MIKRRARTLVVAVLSTVGVFALLFAAWVGVIWNLNDPDNVGGTASTADFIAVIAGSLLVGGICLVGAFRLGHFGREWRPSKSAEPETLTPEYDEDAWRKARQERKP